MAVVVFSPELFLQRFPRFVNRETGEQLLTNEELEQAFDIACLLCDNSDSSVIPYNPDAGVLTRQTLLYLLVCHIATMALWPLGQGGPVASATEGSVSASFSIPQSVGADYFNATPCGQAFWQAAQGYLTGGRYFGVRHYHPWG